MSAIGRYSFTDGDGVVWEVRGPSITPGYADCWTVDGKKATVRRIEWLQQAGVHIPQKGIPLVRQEMDSDQAICEEFGVEYAPPEAPQPSKEEQEILDEFGL